MRICVFSQNNPGVYSGGRYHALMLVQSLALAGHEVHYITNALPVFFSDFERLETHADIKVTITPNFLPDLSRAAFDAVIVTPGRSDHLVYYNAARLTALSSGAQLILINFESGNWFNSLAPQPRDLSDWDHWKRIIAHGGTVLSSAHESDRWAREFYTRKQDDTIRFSVWSPPINTIVADSVPESPKEKRAIIISRLSDPHKGLETILDLLPDEMSGWTLTLIVGASQANEDFIANLRVLTERTGILFDYLSAPDDFTKFEYIKRSRILIFPSLFEGYGYPPIEALYCNTEVVCYDLPVVKETCGDAPYYAPHGDQAALKTALRKAICDPIAGQRDHHSAIRDLAHITTAAKRLERVLTEMVAPENRTTDMVPNTQVGTIGLSSRLRRIWPRARRLLTKLIKRFDRLRTSEGRKVFTKRYSVPSLAKKHATSRTVISGAVVNDMGILRIHGWRVGNRMATAVQACIDQDIILPGTLGIKRPDVKKNFPSLGHDRVGFEITGRMPDRDVSGLPVEVLFYKKDELIDQIESVIEAAPPSAINWLSRSQMNPGLVQERVVVIIARLADIRPGSLYIHDTINIFAACKFCNLHPVLLIYGDEASLQPYKTFLEGIFGEIILADQAKPGPQTDKKDPGFSELTVVQKALATVQSQYVLAGVMAICTDFIPLLDDVQDSTHKLLYLEELPDSNADIPEDVIIVSSQKNLIAADTLANRHATLYLPLHPSAFGYNHEPVYGSGRIVIPATGSQNSLDKVREFVCALARAYPDMEAHIQCLDLENQTDNAPEKIGKLVFDRIGLAADTDLLYANAAFVLAPFFAPVDKDSVAVLRRSLCQAAAFGRPILSTQAMANLQSDKTRFIVRDSVETLCDAVLTMLGPAAGRDALLHDAGFAYTRTDPADTYREFRAVMDMNAGTQTLTGKRAHHDPRIEHAVNGLLSVNPFLRTESSARILLGDDLATANILITGLRRLGIEIEGFHSLKTGDMDAEFDESFTVTLPPLNSTEPCIMATLSPEQAGGWDQMISRLGGHTISLIPILRSHEQNRLVELCCDVRHKGHTVRVHDHYVADDWLKQPSDTVFHIMTEAFVLSRKTPLRALKQGDILVVTEEQTGLAAIDRLLKVNPQIKIVSTLAVSGFDSGIQNDIIYLDPSNPPWSAYFMTKTGGRFDHLSPGLKLAHMISHWIGEPMARSQAQADSNANPV